MEPIKPEDANAPLKGLEGKKVLFIDRDGTLIKEAPPTYQLDSFEKVEFYPSMFEYMRRIAAELDFELIMVQLLLL